MALEFNKAFAAVLTAGIAFSLAGFIGKLVVHPTTVSEPAIALGRDAVQQAATPAAAAPALDPIAPLLASANVDNGRQIAQRACASCHNFAQGGPSGVGPNLYGIVGRPHAAVQGFNYSAALRGLSDKPWDYESLNAFIAKPATAIPGTRMAFAGLSSTQQRADVVAYLRSLAESPQPLP